MGTIVRRPQFLEDLRNIWQFIARDSESRADGFVLELEKRYRLLADNPGIGVPRLPRYPTMRIFSYRSYLIVYDALPDGTGIELVRLLHAARDYHRHFDD